MANQKLNKNTHARMLARIQLVLDERARHHAVRIAARNQQAFMMQMNQLAAQYGVDPRTLLAAKAQNARANSATEAPSRELVYVGGEGFRPCKAVHALCATIPNGTRKEMLQLCKDNGINAATASTQVGVYRKNNKMAAE